MEPSSVVTAVKDPGYNRQISKLMVIEAIGSQLGPRAASFQTKLAQDFAECGVNTGVLSMPPRTTLSLDNNIDPQFRAQELALLQSLSPDATLSIIQASYLSTNGVPTIITYALGLFDNSSKKYVWKANVVLDTHFARYHSLDQGDAGIVLADNIIGRMKQDNILTSCRL
jgi:hypothetical protein